MQNQKKDNQRHEHEKRRRQTRPPNDIHRKSTVREIAAPVFEIVAVKHEDTQPDSGKAQEQRDKTLPGSG